MTPVMVRTGAVTTNCVAVAEVTVATTLPLVVLNVTRSFVGFVSNPVPVSVTVAPGGPLIGAKLLMTGGGNVKLVLEFVTVLPEVFTPIGPLVAPLGTVTTSLVGAVLVIVATLPLNVTVSPPEDPNPVPVIVTEVPTPPLVGVKPLIVGGKIVNDPLDLTNMPLAGLTLIWPVVAVSGTVATSCVDVELVTTAGGLTPKSTSVLPGLKPLPVIVTGLPTCALVGVKPLIVGGRTVKAALEHPSLPVTSTITQISPDAETEYGN